MKFEIRATITTTRDVTGTINVTTQDVRDWALSSHGYGDEYSQAVALQHNSHSPFWYCHVADFLESEFASKDDWTLDASDIEIEYSESDGYGEVSDISIVPDGRDRNRSRLEYSTNGKRSRLEDTTNERKS